MGLLFYQTAAGAHRACRLRAACVPLAEPRVWVVFPGCGHPAYPSFYFSRSDNNHKYKMAISII
jgi:hypothetical protein